LDPINASCGSFGCFAYNPGDEGREGVKFFRQDVPLADVKGDMDVLLARGSQRGRIVTPTITPLTYRVHVDPSEQRIINGSAGRSLRQVDRAPNKIDVAGDYFAHRYRVAGGPVPRAILPETLLCAMYPLFEALLLFEKNDTPHLDIHFGNIVYDAGQFMFIDPAGKRQETIQLPHGADGSTLPATLSGPSVSAALGNLLRSLYEGAPDGETPEAARARKNRDRQSFQSVPPEVLRVVHDAVSQNMRTLLADELRLWARTNAAAFATLRTKFAEGTTRGFAACTFTGGDMSTIPGFQAPAVGVASPPILGLDLREAYRFEDTLAVGDFISYMVQHFISPPAEDLKGYGDLLVADLLELAGHMSHYDYKKRYLGRQAYEAYMRLRHLYCAPFKQPETCTVAQQVQPGKLRFYSESPDAVGPAKTLESWVDKEQACAYLTGPISAFDSGFSAADEDDFIWAMPLRLFATRFGPHAVRRAWSQLQTFELVRHRELSVDALAFAKSRSLGLVLLPLPTSSAHVSPPAGKGELTALKDSLMAIAESTQPRRSDFGFSQ
jgi:hypothetical protein